MSVVPSAPIPAGWYPDPAGSFQQRWWTGSSWTNDFAQYRPTLIHSAPVAEQIHAQHVAATVPQQASTSAYLAQQAAATTHATGPVQQQAAAFAPTQTLTRDPEPAVAPRVDPLPAFRLPEADQPPQTVVAQPNAGTATLIPVNSPTRTGVAADNPTFDNDYLPFGSIPEVRRGARLKPERRYTAYAWLLALTPIPLVAGAYAIASYLPVVYTTLVQGILVVLFLLLGFILALSDRRGLYTDGHDYTAPPALALLTPLPYLLVRAIMASRETGRGTAWPLVLLLIVAGGIAAALLLVDGLLSLLVTSAGLY